MDTADLNNRIDAFARKIISELPSVIADYLREGSEDFASDEAEDFERTTARRALEAAEARLPELTPHGIKAARKKS